jgi:3-dehydroquinate dehydratase
LRVWLPFAETERAMILKSLAGLVALFTIGAAEFRDVEQYRSDIAIDQFNQQIAVYDAIHRRASSEVAMRISADPAAIADASHALAEAIRMARRHALRGDVFSVEASAAIRHRIDLSLQAHGLRAMDVIDALTRDTSMPAAVLNVNSRFDWRYGALMPAALLEVLPALPESVQYRLVGGALVLIDIDADLVVDVLPDALP